MTDTERLNHLIDWFWTDLPDNMERNVALSCAVDAFKAEHGRLPDVAEIRDQMREIFRNWIESQTVEAILRDAPQ